MFSSRLPAVLVQNAVSRTAEALRAGGTSLLDLTQTNPTEVGISYPPDVVSSLADPRGLHYAPDPLGLESARAAVAASYQRAGQAISADRVALTASTSEAYALLFKLLADPGDHVLVPQPSYPLFELLTNLDGVAARPYQLEYQGAWSIDRASVLDAITPTTRAVLVVSPNNPTGSRLRASDREFLVELCASRDVALISDEVFADYPLAVRPDATSLVGETRALTFALGGLSKSAGLPQLKLGWIVMSGPPALVADARARLEMICDTYLSVATPVQLAAPTLLERAGAIRAAIAERLASNLRALRARVAETPEIALLEPEGGWSVVLRVPRSTPEEALVLRLLEEARVLVHPGYFFDFAAEGFLVLSLPPDSATFDEALRRLLPIASGRAS